VLWIWDIGADSVKHFTWTFSEAPAGLQYYIYQSNNTTLENFFYVHIDIHVCSLMNISLNKNVPFYSIIVLLSICEEQLIECVDPGYRRFFFILWKVSGFKTNNNRCNRQASLQNEFILCSVGRCNLVSKVLDSTPANVANRNTKYL
jgi:hypothetical protein